MQKSKGIASFFTGFIITILIIGVVSASYIIIEKGESKLTQNPKQLVSLVFADQSRVSVSLLNKSVDIDRTKISTTMDKLKPLVPTTFLIFIEIADNLSSYGAEIITSLL